jgi:hypothetical protein
MQEINYIVALIKHQPTKDKCLLYLQTTDIKNIQNEDNILGIKSSDFKVTQLALPKHLSFEDQPITKSR